MNTTPTNRPAAFIIATIFFALLGVCAVWLLLASRIGEPSFMGLVVIGLVGGCLIAFMGQLESIKASEFEVRFREVKASEAAVKQLSLLMADYAEASREGAYVGLTDDAAAKVQRCIDEIRKNAA